jgi:hypothetical protein
MPQEVLSVESSSSSPPEATDKTQPKVEYYHRHIFATEKLATIPLASKTSALLPEEAPTCAVCRNDFATEGSLGRADCAETQG